MALNVYDGTMTSPELDAGGAQHGHQGGLTVVGDDGGGTTIRFEPPLELHNGRTIVGHLAARHPLAKALDVALYGREARPDDPHHFSGERGAAKGGKLALLRLRVRPHRFPRHEPVDRRLDAMLAPLAASDGSAAVDGRSKAGGDASAE